MHHDTALQQWTERYELRFPWAARLNAHFWCRLPIFQSNTRLHDIGGAEQSSSNREFNSREQLNNPKPPSILEITN